MLKGIIFDMDGVLINSEIYYYNALVQLIESDGRKVDREDFKKIVGLSGQDSHDIISSHYEEDFDHNEFSKRFRSQYMGDNIDYNEMLFSYVPKALEELKSKGYKLALASSSSMRTIGQAIDQCGIRKYFDFIIGGDLVNRPKPDSEIYLKAMEGLGLKSEECIAIEDSFAGIKAARNAGLFTIAKKDMDFSINQSAANVVLDDMDFLATLIEIIANNKTGMEYSSLDYGTKLYLKAHMLTKEISDEVFDSLNNVDLFRLAITDEHRLIGYLEIDKGVKSGISRVILNPEYEDEKVKEELEKTLSKIKEFYY